MTTYKGMNAQTGRAIYDINHLNQSVKDILNTPLATRLMRRAYGSLVFTMIDAPANSATQLQLFAAIATGLLRHEPRLKLHRIQIISQSNGQGIVDIDGVSTINSKRKAVSISAPIGVSV